MPQFVKLKGLEEAFTYIDLKSGTRYSGSGLMYGGYPISDFPEAYQGMQIHFKVTK